MKARATKVVINPRQENVAPVTCAPDVPYREDKLPAMASESDVWVVSSSEYRGKCPGDAPK
jgi:hypothetical protein